MSSQKTPLSSSKRAVPIKIKILNHSDRDNFPYADLEPRWSFAMPLMPLTKISELCLHAVGQVQRVFNDAVDAARLEARDRDGHVFHGMETISEEILNGETIYLIEGEGTGKGKGKERGRLLSLRTGAEQAYRTPSASSRSSSQSRRKTQSLPKPRMTPSQRALAIAKAGWTPMTEPVRERRISTDNLGMESLPGLPSPGPSHVGPAAALPELSKQREDASDATDDAPTEPRQDTSVAPSQRCSPPPETSPRLQDSQRIVPDSQDTSSRTHIQTPSASRAKLGSAFKPKRVASEHQPRSAQPLDMLNADKLQNIPSSIKTLVSRPDPYDISTVLSDDENYSPKRSNSIMFSSARKLGSASKRRPPATQPSIRQPQLNIDSPTRISKSVTADRYGTARSMHFSNPSTPNKKTSAPYKEVASSPAVALSSSPTNNVAAVIAKGRDRIMRRPIPECVVIDDSEVEIDEDLFRNPPGLSTSVPEALLPWSQPPLRATQDGTLGVRPVARRTTQSGGVGEAGTKDIVEGDNDIVDSKADVRRLIDAAKETLAAVRDSNNLRARELSTGAISPLHLNSPVKGPSKSAPTTPSGKKTSEHVMIEQHTVDVIHSSTSEDENNGSDEGARIIKEEQSDDDSWKNLPPVALPSSPSPQDHGDKANEKEVIELSSDSDSSIDPAWLDDYEDELPALPEFPVTEEPLLPDPASRDIELPAPTVPVQLFVTDPIEPRVNESPPSAQPDKRKRSVSDEPNSEDERQRKKAKKLKARKARKVLRKAKRREDMARMEEERKRLALEQAHRRALELEIVVSSPSKAKVVDSDDAEAESDDDSGLGLGILDEDENVEDVGVPLYGDNHDASLSSEETEDRLAWLHRKHPTPSPEMKPGSPKTSADVVRPESPVAEDAHAPQQHSDDLNPTGDQYHRRIFDDWAALEARLGCGGLGYSPLEVHNRIHLATVHRSLQVPLEPSRDSPDQDSSPKSPPKLAVEAHPSPPRSTRCGAPSPKDTPLAQQTASTGGRKKGGKGKKHKTQARHLHHRKRRGEFNKRRARQYYPEFRDLIDAIKKNH